MRQTIRSATFAGQALSMIEGYVEPHQETWTATLKLSERYAGPDTGEAVLELVFGQTVRAPGHIREQRDETTTRGPDVRLVLASTEDAGRGA